MLEREIEREIERDRKRERERELFISGMRFHAGCSQRSTGGAHAKMHGRQRVKQRRIVPVMMPTAGRSVAPVSRPLKR